MSNRVLIHIASGRRYEAQTKRDERLFEKLAQSDAYMFEGDRIEVTTQEAVAILEAERQALIAEREALEKAKQEFEESKVNIEQPVKRRQRQTK